MKAGIEHRVPLSKRALDILKLVQPFSSETHVFPGGKKDKSLSNMAMSMLLRRMGYDAITVHGFRSTFRNWAGEQTNYLFEAPANKLLRTARLMPWQQLICAATSSSDAPTSSPTGQPIANRNARLRQRLEHAT